MNAPFGHNEMAARLGLLAEDARKGLARVAAGEAYTIDGWLAYGAALNEGRALFPSDEQFGQWVEASVNDNLSFTPNLHERAAAMWAAANPEQFEEARAVDQPALDGLVLALRHAVEALAGVLGQQTEPDVALIMTPDLLSHRHCQPPSMLKAPTRPLRPKASRSA